MIVSKAAKMAEMMNIPIIGVVENMSYFKCPDNDKDYKIFGDSHIEEIADKHNLKVLAKLPIDPKISAACDKGIIELFDGDWLEKGEEIMWECRVCGHLVIGKKAPEVCPVCKFAQSYFEVRKENY